MGTPASTSTAIAMSWPARVPSGVGRFVDPPRLLAALDLAADDAVSGAHRHGVHRGAVGEGEAVDGLHRLGEAAREHLRDRDPGDEARYLDRDVGVLERAGAEGP